MKTKEKYYLDNWYNTIKPFVEMDKKITMKNIEYYKYGLSNYISIFYDDIKNVSKNLNNFLSETSIAFLCKYYNIFNWDVNEIKEKCFEYDSPHNAIEQIILYNNKPKVNKTSALYKYISSLYDKCKHTNDKESIKNNIIFLPHIKCIKLLNDSFGKEYNIHYIPASYRFNAKKTVLFVKL